MQRVLQALAELATTTEGYNPDVDANDSGRRIIFWRGTEAASVFVPSHPAGYRPSTSCLIAFDRLWSLLAANE